jgi:hypothetical protein
LIKLPVQRKKKLIIIEEFLKKFRSDKKYSEIEVNDLILEQYDDYCTIRRTMIEEGMMRRKDQIYWKCTKKD